MRRCVRALLVACLFVASHGHAKPAARKDTRAAARCQKTYAREFVEVRDGAKVRLRLVRYDPQAPGPAIFDEATELCRKLGEGWRVAVGSFHESFLPPLAASASKPLKAALAACPVTYRHVDTVCAPCVAGSTNCPCADRHISDWLFCERSGQGGKGGGRYGPLASSAVTCR